MKGKKSCYVTSLGLLQLTCFWVILWIEQISSCKKVDIFHALVASADLRSWPVAMAQKGHSVILQSAVKQT